MLGLYFNKFLLICLAVEIEILEVKCNGSVLEVKWNSRIFEDITQEPDLEIQVCFTHDFKSFQLYSLDNNLLVF